MTEEARKKANELAAKIKDTELYLRDCNEMLEQGYNGVEVRLPICATILKFKILQDICHEILKISEKALECQLKQLEKEFEKL